MSIIFECRLNQNTNWAGKGHLVAWDQITLQKSAGDKVPRKIGKTVKKIDASLIKLSSEGNEISFNEKGLFSWKQKNKELLEGHLMLNFWRAPTDND